jgi:outer membrane immunogenic protein
MSKRTIAQALLFAGVTLMPLGFSSPAMSGFLDPAPAYNFSPEYNWTGLYSGLNGGATLGRASWESDPDLTSGAVTKSAGVVGLTLGYNAQNLGRLVVGTEFDFNWRNLDFTIPAGTCGLGCEFKSSWFSTARLRFGYQIDRFLPYVTAGMSISDFTADTIGQPNGFSKNISFNFTAGAGVELAIVGSLTGKLEYLFINHDSIACVTACNGPVNMRLGENVLRVGMNYKLWDR